MFSLFRRKPKITGASWTDESGKTVTAKFDPPHTSIYRALNDVNEMRS